jgi:hypothetical protein
MFPRTLLAVANTLIHSPSLIELLMAFLQKRFQITPEVKAEIEIV